MKIVFKSLITMFTAVVLVACNSDDGSVVSNASEAASEAVEGTLESVGGALDGVTESAGDMVDSASDAVGDAVDGASEMAADAADAISNMGEEAIGELNEELSDVEAADVDVDTSAIDDAKAEVDTLLQ